VPVSFKLGLSPQGGSLHDLNGDGALDLVVADNEAGELSLLLGGGSSCAEVQ